MVRVSVLVAMLLVACKQKESPRPEAKPTATSQGSNVGSAVVPGALRHTTVKTSYAIAIPAGSDVAALEKLVRAKSPKVEISRVSLADMFNEAQQDFMMKTLPQPDAEAVRAAVVIRLGAAGSDAIKLVRELAEVTRDVADAAHGWVLDPETLQIHQAAAFHDHVPADHLDVRKLIMVHSIVGGNEQPFLDTVGLHRYGFPELFFAETATGHINQVTHLMNGAAQTLLDGGDVNDLGEISIDFHKLGWNVDIIGAGTGRAVLKARWARERDAGDDDELVVELVPPTGAGPEGAAKLIDECFGHEPDKVTVTKQDDPELMAAGAKARADLGKLRSHFVNGIPPDERLTIKTKFTDDESQVEWMWVDVVAFKGNTFEGTLANDPELIESLRNGQKVKVKLADVGDYFHEKRGGVRAGGYSIEVFKKRGLYPSDAD